MYFLRFDDISSRRSFLVTTVHEKCHTPVVGYKEQEWRDEVPRIGRWFDTFGWRLPREMVDELVNLEIALGTRGTTAE